jgi:hypothetical protein
MVRLEAQLDLNYEIHPLMQALLKLKDHRKQRVQYFVRLLDSPSKAIQELAWTYLAELAPDAPELRTFAIEQLQGFRRNEYLTKLLTWARTEPGLLARIERHVHIAYAKSGPDGFWMLTRHVVASGPAGHDFAPLIAAHYFRNRVATNLMFPSGNLSTTYQSGSPEFQKFLLESGTDLGALCKALHTAALRDDNPHRFDDARMLTQLGGDPEFEVELLKNHLLTSSVETRKNGLSRYSELVAAPDATVAFLKPFLADADPQMRRRALEEFAKLKVGAAERLPEFDRLSGEDSSQIVRWQARRTANIVRGLGANDGIREPRPRRP